MIKSLILTNRLIK